MGSFSDNEWCYYNPERCQKKLERVQLSTMVSES